VDLIFQSIAGTEAANRSFGVSLSLLSEAHEAGNELRRGGVCADGRLGSNIMYCASKAAVDNMTRSLARALAPAVRVISVSPGLVDTDFVKSVDPAWREEQAARTPLGRLAAPAEVAAAVVAAVRDLTFTTGCILAVDGGRPLN